jgi:hypothetical protein
MRTLLKLSIIAFLFTQCLTASAQENTEEETVPTGKQKPLKVGLYIGSYFANKYTASAYDGYGFDIDGKRINNFTQSYMYEKIINQYGGYNGVGTDQIAQALNVNHGDWDFTQDDMPVNMRYTPAFILGLQGRYSVDKKNAISLNVNAAKLKVTGNFTISTVPPAGSTQINKSVQTFGITGGEQRLIFQVGYARILGNSEKANFFLEGGVNITWTQFDKNQILINSLLIDLTESYTQPGVPQTYYTLRPRGLGLGAYGALGLNITINPKWIVQLMYSPSYEGIKIVENSRLKLQHQIGLRAYYNF